MDITKLIDRLDIKLGELRNELSNTEAAALRIQGGIIALQEERKNLVALLEAESDQEDET